MGAKLLGIILILAVILYLFNALFPSNSKAPPDFLGSYERLYGWLINIANVFDNLRTAVVGLLERLVPITETLYEAFAKVADWVEDIYNTITGNGGTETTYGNAYSNIL